MSEISMVLSYFLWLVIFLVMRIQRWLRFCNVSHTHLLRLSSNKSIRKICLVRNFWSVAILFAKYNISDDVDLSAFPQVPDSKTRKSKPTAYKSISTFEGGGVIPWIPCTTFETCGYSRYHLLISNQCSRFYYNYFRRKVRKLWKVMF